VPVDWSIGAREVGLWRNLVWGRGGSFGMVRPENLRATRISAMRGLFLFWFIAALALSPSMVIALARRRTKCSGFEGRSILFFSPPSWGSKSIVMGIWRRKSYHGTLPSPVRLPCRAHFPDFGGPQDSCCSRFEAVAITKELLLHLQVGRGESLCRGKRARVARD
jgi:hypothetical protein